MIEYSNYFPQPLKVMDIFLPLRSKSLSVTAMLKNVDFPEFVHERVVNKRIWRLVIHSFSHTSIYL